jgi:hypothetical protein
MKGRGNRPEILSNRLRSAISGIQNMSIRRNSIYVFRKSGNLVQAVEPTCYGGRGNWIVKRVDGTNAGKVMIVPGRALVT